MRKTGRLLTRTNREPDGSPIRLVDSLADVELRGCGEVHAPDREGYVRQLAS